MPLIVITGFPASGKTHVTNQLKQFFEKLDKKVVVISENDILRDNALCRNDLYKDSRKEKEIRSIIKSSFTRSISPDEITIIDGLNYIKGYRYELYCVTKSAKTTQCTLHCQTGPDAAWENNQKREESERYSREIFDALVLRYEPPDSRNRWDSPLFYLLSDSSVPLQDIQDALYSRKPPPPNQSTQCPPVSDTNFLHELDNTTKSVIDTILASKKLNMEGEIKIPGSDECFVLSTEKNTSLPELLRLRRQFLSYVKLHPTLYNNKSLSKLFVQYLNSNL
ncbi:hypothetical protein RUM44_003617 [Polyplax serrata]|uniref:Protein KTI12 homolog n=1 Tax=Polyplax serrata TaxID=468196 RepID=A0ABR1AGY9_POLSC